MVTSITNIISARSSLSEVGYIKRLKFIIVATAVASLAYSNFKLTLASAAVSYLLYQFLSPNNENYLHTFADYIRSWNLSDTPSLSDQNRAIQILHMESNNDGQPDNTAPNAAISSVSLPRSLADILLLSMYVSPQRDSSNTSRHRVGTDTSTSAPHTVTLPIDHIQNMQGADRHIVGQAASTGCALETGDRHRVSRPENHARGPFQEPLTFHARSGGDRHQVASSSNQRSASTSNPRGISAADPRHAEGIDERRHRIGDS